MKLVKVLASATIAVCLLPAVAAQPQHALTPAHPQKPVPAPDVCFERAMTTADMVVCADQEYQRLDQELNRVYAALLAEMTPAQAQLLRDAQRRWLSFRDAEFSAINGVYDAQDGTLYRVLRLGQRNQVVRHRVEQLTSLRDAISGASIGPDPKNQPGM